MTRYRLCWLGPKGNVLAVQQLDADNDKEALSIARETVKGASWLSGFELWEGERKVRGETTRRKSR